MCDVMYICKDCGHVFEHPTDDFNRSANPYDEDAACPRCRSDNYDEAVRCKDCEDWFAEGDTYYGLCKSCLAEKAKEYAHEFVMADPSVRSDFAWWLADRLKREG